MINFENWIKATYQNCDNQSDWQGKNKTCEECEEELTIHDYSDICEECFNITQEEEEEEQNINLKTIKK
jgi:hypothetical protein